MTTAERHLIPKILLNTCRYWGRERNIDSGYSISCKLNVISCESTTQSLTTSNACSCTFFPYFLFPCIMQNHKTFKGISQYQHDLSKINTRVVYFIFAFLGRGLYTIFIIPLLFLKKKIYPENSHRNTNSDSYNYCCYHAKLNICIN